VAALQGDIKTVFSRPHIMRGITRVVDTVRKQEHRALEASRELSTCRQGPSGKRKAGGFRNAQHFTTAIYFRCGGLDLSPR
jgi:transposase